VRSAKYKFHPGDVLYGKLRPYLDKGGLVDFEGICSTDIIVIKPKESIDAQFLSFLIHHDAFREYATKTMTGVNHPRTSWRSLSQFPAPLPPIHEQKQIAHILSTVDKKIEVEQRRKQVLKQLFKTILHKLMSGEIRLKDVEI
jgi:type I restriction enzyme S subunit